MGFLRSPKSPAPPSPTAPVQQIDAASKESMTEEEKQLALMRGIQSTWTSQSMMGPASGAANPSSTTGKATKLGG